MVVDMAVITVYDLEYLIIITCIIDGETRLFDSSYDHLLCSRCVDISINIVTLDILYHNIIIGSTSRRRLIELTFSDVYIFFLIPTCLISSLVEWKIHWLCSLRSGFKTWRSGIRVKSI